MLHLAGNFLAADTERQTNRDDLTRPSIEFDFPLAAARTPHLTSLVDRHPFQSGLRPDIFGSGTNQTVIGVLFEDMRCPTSHPADGEKRCEQVDSQSDDVVAVVRSVSASEDWLRWSHR